MCHIYAFLPVPGRLSQARQDAAARSTKTRGDTQLNLLQPPVAYTHTDKL